MIYQWNCISLFFSSKISFQKQTLLIEKGIDHKRGENVTICAFTFTILSESRVRSASKIFGFSFHFFIFLRLLFSQCKYVVLCVRRFLKSVNCYFFFFLMCILSILFNSFNHLSTRMKKREIGRTILFAKMTWKPDYHVFRAQQW